MSDAETSKRKPGERKLQILQSLVEMLENPKGQRVTTALLAEKVGVSEAALYRHFASKAQMFDALIEFIEQTLLGLAAEIAREQSNGLAQADAMIKVLLEFAQTNKGMTRVLVGDALVNEDTRLQNQINDLLLRLESVIKQAFREALISKVLPEGGNVSARAEAVLNYVMGAWTRYAKSGFKHDITAAWAAHRNLFLA